MNEVRPPGVPGAFRLAPLAGHGSGAGLWGNPLRDVYPVRRYLPVGRNLFMGDPGNGCFVSVPLWLMCAWYSA